MFGWHPSHGAARPPTPYEHSQTTHLFWKPFLTTSLSSCYVMEEKKKKTPSEDCMVLQLRNQFLFILDKKKNQLEKERQSKVEKNNFFFIPEILNGWCRRHSLLFMPVNNELHKSTWIQASMTLLWVVMLAVTGSPKDATGLSTFFLQKSRRAETSMAGNSSVWSFSKR